jgi:hypothetical protein
MNPEIMLPLWSYLEGEFRRKHGEELTYQYGPWLRATYPKRWSEICIGWFGRDKRAYGI